MAIELTTTAAERIRNFVERDGGVGLRLGVKKTGCSGWAYTVDLAREVLDDDLVFEQDGVKVVVASDSISFLDGSTIDFKSEGLGSAFHFDNPNATEECGCGESFTIG
jgi:iron-sulfur cluster assembly protein